MTVAASGGLHELPPSSAHGGGTSTLSAVVAITTELFGSTHVYQDADPEFAEDAYTVFAVECADPIEDVLKKERAWVQRVQAIAPRCDYRLSILPSA